MVQRFRVQGSGLRNRRQDVLYKVIGVLEPETVRINYYKKTFKFLKYQ